MKSWLLATFICVLLSCLCLEPCFAEVKSEEILLAEIEKARTQFRTNTCRESLENWHQVAFSAIQSLPDSPIIVSRFVEVNYIKDGDPVHVFEKLKPFLEMEKTHNSILFTGWLVLNNCKRNIDIPGRGTDFLLTYHNWPHLLEKEQLNEKTIKELTCYFARRIDMDSLTHYEKGYSNLILKDKDYDMQINEIKMKNLVSDICNKAIEYSKLMQSIEKMFLPRQPKPEKNVPASITLTPLPDNSSLDDLLKASITKEKWDVQDIEIYLSRLKAYRKELIKHENFPELETLKQKYPNDNTPIIINLWYKYAIHKSYQQIIQEIRLIEHWDKETRLLFLYLLCGRQVGLAKGQLLEMTDKLIEQHPDNQRFKNIKASIENGAY